MSEEPNSNLEIDFSTFKFEPGAIHATIGATLAASQFEMAEMIRRHLSGDWGDVDPDDAKANDKAVKLGDRILSSYTSKSGEKLWVETTADRSSTCVMLPGDY